MKKYLVLYRSPVSAAEQMARSTPEQGKKMMEAWMAWAGRAGKAIVDMGSPTNSVAHVSGGNLSGFIGGFSILQAESTDGVKKVLEGHPHLAMGGSIEVLELMPVPGM
jgi:hypothetical protein